MKKLLIAGLISFGMVGTSSAAISSTVAELSAVDAMENVMIINNAIPDEIMEDSHMIAYGAVTKLTAKIDKSIVNGLNEDVPCEIITSVLTTQNFTPWLKSIQKVHSTAADRSNEKLVSALATYTLAKCTEIKG